MELTYPETVEYVFGFTNYEFTPLAGAPAEALELTRLRSLLRRLGDPQRAARAVHITGSKGKGSTAAMIEALLRRSGARTGLYTSPHLHTPRERIAIDGEPIPEAEFAALVNALRPHAEAENATRSNPVTTFELLTALAFLAFRERRCDWQVVEVGLGGRLDATNVLDEKHLCVFTPISLEHTAILGPTTAAIAADKAGILRRGVRAVMAPQDDQAAAVLRGACAALEAPLAESARECRWSAASARLDGQDGIVCTPQAVYCFTLPLLGAHQVENAAVALRGVELLRPSGVYLDPAQAAQALAAVRWPGRLEVLSRRPLVLADGAHNAASAQRLAEALQSLLSPSPTDGPSPAGDPSANRQTPPGSAGVQPAPGDGPGAERRSTSPDPRELASPSVPHLPVMGPSASGGPQATEDRTEGPLTLVIGTLSDKDLPGIAAALAPLVTDVIAVEPALPRARPALDVATAFAAAGAPASPAESVAAGLQRALARTGAAGAICVAGSLYTVAEARAALLHLPAL